MWPVIRRTSVPPTEMSKDHRPPSSPTGGAARPACRRWERQNLGGPPRRAQLHSLDPRRFSPSGVPRRWHRRCLTDRHRQRCSDERRIPPPSARHVAHCTPGRSPSGAGRVQRRHPQMGRGRSRGTAPPRTSLLPSFHSILPPLVCPSDPAGQDTNTSRCDTVCRDLAIRPGLHNEYHRNPSSTSMSGHTIGVEWAPNRVTRMLPVCARAWVWPHGPPWPDFRGTRSA